MKLLYDIEADGLLDVATKIWCIVAYNLDTDTVYKFTDSDGGHGSISDGIALLNGAELLVGHNVIGYDNALVQKLFGVALNDKPCHDTFIMSQVLRYKRDHKHGLAGWGEKLHNSKIEFHDFSCYSKEMLRYCVQDVKLNVQIYRELLGELNKIASRYPLIKEGLTIEHDVAKFNVTARTSGWNFDLEQARETQRRMQECMKNIEECMHPKLGMRTVYIDKEPKTPKFKKNGEYNSHTVRHLSEYFGKEVKPSDTHLLAAGETYQRTTQEQIEMGSIDLVKDWLLENGWKPDEYQRKKVGFDWINTSPKLTTTSLEKLGEIGRMVDEYYTMRNRHAVVEGWIEKVKNRRLHGNMWTCGTPTFRCRHEVIVNLPAVTAKWGKELRELLKADDGMVLVGCDSAGNQLRGLCHYVRNDSFTREVIYGDQHQRNADILNCSRPVAKSYLYAYLFGAGDGKLGKVLTGKTNTKLGKESKEKFAKGIKGLGELREKLSNIWKKTHYQQGNGWFPALDGRPIFCASDHQALNYLLQSAEAITCKAAVSYAMAEIKREGLRAEPRLFYHDEQAWQAHPDDADRVGEILKLSFEEGPKKFGVNCMNGGDYVIGNNYSDVH